MKRGRAALIMFGHLRTYRDCHASLRKLLIEANPHLEFDLFMHTWDTTEVETHTWHKSHGRPMPVDPSIKSHLMEAYRPVELLVEAQKDTEFFAGLPFYEVFDQHTHRSIDAVGLKNSTYSFQQANTLRERYEQSQDWSYDLVMSIRPDILLLQPIELDLEFLTSDRQLCFFTLPHHRSTCPGRPKLQRLDSLETCFHLDIISFGPSKAMSRQAVCRPLVVFLECFHRHYDAWSQVAQNLTDEFQIVLTNQTAFRSYTIRRPSNKCS